MGLRQTPGPKRVKESDRVTLNRTNVGAEAGGGLGPAIHGMGVVVCLEIKVEGDPGLRRPWRSIGSIGNESRARWFMMTSLPLPGEKAPSHWCECR